MIIINANLRKAIRTVTVVFEIHPANGPLSHFPERLRPEVACPVYRTSRHETRTSFADHHQFSFGFQLAPTVTTSLAEMVAEQNFIGSLPFDIISSILELAAPSLSPISNLSPFVSPEDMENQLYPMLVLNAVCTYFREIVRSSSTLCTSFRWSPGYHKHGHSLFLSFLEISRNRSIHLNLQFGTVQADDALIHSSVDLIILRRLISLIKSLTSVVDIRIDGGVKIPLREICFQRPFHMHICLALQSISLAGIEDPANSSELFNPFAVMQSSVVNSSSQKSDTQHKTVPNSQPDPWLNSLDKDPREEIGLNSQLNMSADGAAGPTVIKRPCAFSPSDLLDKYLMKCLFLENATTCERCKAGGHVCVVEGRGRGGVPNKREYLLAQIGQKDALIDALLKQLRRSVTSDLSDQEKHDVLAWLDSLQSTSESSRDGGTPVGLNIFPAIPGIPSKEEANFNGS
ncbi:hypothetical protein NP233_g9894 [Leucocoprinus birnbaumii]|uniref:Cytochrome c domain-containing protein n=1 Tax=Leucocoprinus birnbaumii TaxID=56174 RepID=A0AAD5VJK8_9AGAR|nr:hypothetical protein NP233_g9894 [Leucocoprinus birnbaumii]